MSEVPFIDPRPESADQRADRNWIDILQELRVTQTGTQVLTGFLLAVAFQPAFSTLGVYEKSLYLVLVALAAFATILGIAPVVLHRRLFATGQKQHVVTMGNRVMLVLLVVVPVLASGVTSLIFDITVNRTAGLVALAICLAATAVIWLVVPRMSRRLRS